MIKIMCLLVALTSFCDEKIINEILTETKNVLVEQVCFDEDFFKKHSNALLSGHITGYYDKINQKIYLPRSRSYLIHSELVKHSDDVDLLFELMLFHEKVHAFLHKKGILGSDLIFCALNEGFAEYCTWLYSKQKGIEKLFLLRQKHFLSMGQIELNKQCFYLDVCFFYHDAFLFFKQVVNPDKEYDLNTYFVSNKPTIKEILFPKLYLNKEEVSVKSIHPRKGALINHLGLRKFINENKLFVGQAAKNSILRNFEYGYQCKLDKELGVATVLFFEEEKKIQTFYEKNQSLTNKKVDTHWKRSIIQNDNNALGEQISLWTDKQENKSIVLIKCQNTIVELNLKLSDVDKELVHNILNKVLEK